MKNRTSESEKMWQVGVEVVKKKIPGRDHLEKKCRHLTGRGTSAQRENAKQTRLGDLVIE